jgi:hypothetical protein
MRAFLIVTTILLISATWSRAEDLKELQTRIDKWWEENGKTISAAQDEYKKDHPVYFQGLKTHAVVPDQKEDKTDDKIPDKANAKPSGQAESWVDVVPAIAAEVLPCALTIDVYDGPQGKGYVVTLLVKFEGVAYVKRVNTGPEAERDLEWTEYKEEQLEIK